MNKTDKDFIESKLRNAISLVYKDQTAQALREIADAVSVVAVALESQTSGVHSMTLQDFATSQSHTHFHSIFDGADSATVDPMTGRDYSRCLSASEALQITEKTALDTVKPLCKSGLLATLSGVSGSKNPQCPACGLFHDRRVVVVELSSLGLHMLKHEGAMRIGGGEENPDKYRQDDRVIFTENTAPLKGDVILGNVVRMFSGPYGREASIEVVKS